MLELRNISFHQGDEIFLDDVSLLMERGELNILLGPTLSGKTTLMLQIARALPVGRHARIVTYNRVRPPYDRPDPLLKSSAPH